jgi:subtilisin family serine protease
VVGVAALDANGVIYAWSAHGRWVGLAAPGCSVGTARGNDYGAFCGTSAAAAYVSGVAGLALSAAPAASGATVEQALLDHAATGGTDVAAGTVDAFAVVAALAPPAAAPATVETTTKAAPPARKTPKKKARPGKKLHKTVGPPRRAHRVAARPHRPAVR